MNFEIFDNSDLDRFESLRKGRISQYPWDTTPVGKSFFVQCSEEEVQVNKKRPAIPSRFIGQYRTKGVRDKSRGIYGYICMRGC